VGCVRVQLRRGSIIADFIVSAPANVSLDAAVDILQVSTRLMCIVTSTLFALVALAIVESLKR